MNVSERFLNYVKYGTQSDITSSPYLPPKDSWFWLPGWQMS